MYVDSIVYIVVKYRAVYFNAHNERHQLII